MRTRWFQKGADTAVRPDKYSLLLGAILGVESLSYAIVLPLVPFIAQQYGADALAIGGIFAVYSICQLLTSPGIGAFSDSWGRKPLLLLSQATTCAGFLILAVSNSLGLIFLSRAVDGASAGNVSLIYTAVLDRYPRAQRTQVLGFLSTATGLGILAGPLIGGLLGATSLVLPALVAAGLTVITLVLTAGGFPRRARPRRAVDFRAALALLRHPVLQRTLRVILINNVIFNAFVLTLPVFLQQRVGATEKEVGLFLTGLLMVGAVFQVLGLPRLLAVAANRTSARLGFALYIAGFAVLAFAAQWASVTLAGALVLGGLIILNPVLAGALGNEAEGTDDGALMGINQAVASTGQIIGPLIGYGALYLGSSIGLVAGCLALSVLGLILLRGVAIYESAELLRGHSGLQ
jgi:DHA1 family tetracycline resistance protein-like MFS transporter